jgi:hypothetical protein
MINYNDMNNYEKKTLNWWYCDNIVHQQHEGQIGLLHLGEPSVFILVRDYADMYFRSYDEFASHIAEVNFLYPEERKDCDLEELLTDAWNFMALQERKEEEMYDEEWE